MVSWSPRSFAHSVVALLVAVGGHVALAAGLIYLPPAEVVPPRAVGSFEVVDLSAFGVEAQPDPEPEKQDEPVETAKTEPDRVVDQKPEPEPEPEPELEPELTKPEPQPLPKPVVRPKPKPKPKPVKTAKAEPKPEQEPELIPKPKPKPVKKPQAAAVGSQKAFIPPSSTAAYLQNPKPTYPALAQRRGMEGVVLLLVEVSVDGKPLSVKVKKGSGYSVLDKAALRAVQAWRFAPATRGGRSVAANVEVPIRFTLKDT